MSRPEPPLGEPVAPPPPRQRPTPRVLEGRLVRLEPVDPDRHAAELFAGSHPPAAGAALWAYMSMGPFPDLAAMRSWLAGCAASADPLHFVVVDRASGLARGMAALMRIAPEHAVIEVGSIWYAPAVQRTALPTEAMYLLFRHVFDDLAYRRLEWKCNDLNEASKRAARRLGFSDEGLFRQHMIVKGRSRDTAWFSLLDSEWPAVRTAMEAWLAPANFDAEGRQRVPLGDMVGRARADHP